MPQSPSVFLQQKTQKFSYDFAVDGGAIGNITLRGGTIPSGAILVAATTDQKTAFTSAGAATVAVGLETAGDLQSQQVYSDITFTGTLTAIALVGATGVLSLGAGTYGITGGPIKTAAERSVVMAIADAVLTGGAFDLYITYLVP